MPAVRQLPAKLDLECIAGDPFTVTITATGITTLTSPAVTMTTSGGDAYTTDPGIPTASVAGLAVTSAWSAADTAALNATTRGKTYRYSIAANPNSAGLFEIVAGTLTVHPVGHAGTSSASSATLAVTVGTTAVSLAVALGGGGGGGASALDDLTDVTITSATNGQVLKYNGSAWVNGTDATGGGGGALDDLTDVTITAAASGDILRYNGTAWVDTPGTTHFEVAGAAAAAQAASQPLDSDLTAIAALSTTAYGRAFLTLANQAATMALLSAASETASGIVELATNAETATGTDTARAVTPANLASVLSSYLTTAAAASGYQPLDSDLTAIAALTTTAYGRAFLSLANLAALQAVLGTGTPSATTYLRGDGTWATPAGGGSTVVRKSADETVTSSITLQDDDHLTFAVDANSVYVVRGVLFYNGAATGDIKVALNGPAGATVKVGFTAGRSSNTDQLMQSSATTALASGLVGGAVAAGTTSIGYLDAVVTISSTAGSVTFQWTQNTSDATATTVLADSYLEYRKL